MLFVSLTLDQTQADEIIWKKDDAKMVLIPAGSFEMGDHLDGKLVERPVHTVELDAFYMDIHEVTVRQFKKFIDDTDYMPSVVGHCLNCIWKSLERYWTEVSEMSPTGLHPIVYVSWNDAIAYCEWAGKRLPTEAEWEYAARGGLSGKHYPWGDGITHDDANFQGIGGKDKWDRCAPVGSFTANGYGLYDMAGNVHEWCADWWSDKYYNISPTPHPKGPDSGSSRVRRGGV